MHNLCDDTIMESSTFSMDLAEDPPCTSFLAKRTKETRLESTGAAGLLTAEISSAAHCFVTQSQNIFNMLGVLRV